MFHPASGSSGVGTLQKPLPRNWIRLTPVSEPPALLSPLRKHTDEPSSFSVEVAHLFAATQLRVRHVDEVTATGDPAQILPDLDVGLVIGGVAVEALVVNRYRPVSADGEAEKKLLQIGPKVLVVSMGEKHRRLTLVA